MSRYILNRAGQALIALFVVTILVFSMVHLSGDPLQVLVPDEAPPEIYEEFRQLLHLDEPIPIQYMRWIGGILTGDFGKSTTKRVPVSQLIGDRLPATLQLAGAGFAFMLVIGLSVGVYAAAFRGSAFDTLARSFAVLGQALPSFWLGLVLILIFAIWWDVFPAGGKSGWSSVVLPGFALGWYPAAGVMRLTRSSMIEVLDAEYVKLARIKGVSERKVLWVHAFKNAALPVLTFSATFLVLMLRGAIIIEMVFSWPGIGRLVLEAVFNRDFPIVQAITLMFSSWFILGNLLVDIGYAYLNPRIRYGVEAN